MIFTETREGRRFVGELDPGLPVIATLGSIAHDYRISSGWIQATGYVRDPIIRKLQPEGGLGEPCALPGLYLVAAMQAPVSEYHGGLDLTVRVLLHGSGGDTVGGLLVEAISASLEIIAQSFDDIVLRRYDDDDMGIARWLDVAVTSADAVPEAVKSGREAMEAMPSRLLEPVEMPQLRVGDYLEHPRLGQCEVTQVVDDERVAIRMTSGKIAQLHLGLLTLKRSKRRQGHNVYEVQIRRRT